MQLFDCIDKNDNIILKNESKEDLLYLKEYLDKYYLEYRKCLGLDLDYTFGFELEFAFKDGFGRTDLINNKWQDKSESTIKNGREIASPILNDMLSTWEDLFNVCEDLNEIACVDQECGGHIHIGSHIFQNDNNLDNFFKLWCAYENICFRFLYGEYVSYRPDLSKYAYPMSRLYFLSGIDRKKTILQKFSAISLYYLDSLEEKLEKNTVEFRVPNGTINPIIWQNNTNFLIKLIEYAKSPYFDIDKVDYRIKCNKKKDIYRLHRYDEIDYEEALELCDLIFNNNLDKAYFLRQYFKDYTEKKVMLIKSRRFTNYIK